MYAVNRPPSQSMTGRAKVTRTLARVGRLYCSQGRLPPFIIMSGRGQGSIFPDRRSVIIAN